jgi:hypothetical protein
MQDKPGPQPRPEHAKARVGACDGVKQLDIGRCVEHAKDQGRKSRAAKGQAGRRKACLLA